jgi:Tfp pilus assembly protein PilF
LARAAGDPNEAEECYRELAILNPRHIEARQALARIALERHDLASAAEHLEQVLRLLPLDALESLLDVRQHLADIYMGLSDWARARTYVELVLVQDPRRLNMLERLSEIYERLGLHVPAVETLSRLARLHPTPRGRAEALLRQGDILGRNLDDETRAFDAYLKSSDLDPTYAPTASRLVNAYWARGQFENVAALGDDLASAALSPALSAARPPQPEGDELPLRLRLAMATALERRDPRAGISAANLSVTAFDPIKAAAVLVEAGAHLSGRSPEALEPALRLLELWRSGTGDGTGDGNGDATPESSGEDPTTLDELRSILWPRLLADPSTPGLARTTGFVAERRGDTIEARVCFSIATFLDDSDGAALRLGTLGPMAPPNLAALALGGPVDDPETSGPMTPMRRSLAALARALAGFQPMEREAGSEELLAVTGSFDVGQRDRLYALAQMFATTDLILTTVSDSPLSFDEPGSVSGRGRGGGSPADVRIVPTRPATVEIPARLNKLPEAELTFLVARGFDRLRSGMALIDLVTSGSADDVASLLSGAEAALSGGDQPTEGLSGAVARAIANPGRLAQLLEGSVPLGAAGNRAGTAEMLADLGRARSALGDWPTFRAAAERAANRFATIACQSVLAALRALYLLRRAPDPDSQMETERGAERNRRASFLRQPPAQELLQFVASTSYARVLTDVSTSAPASIPVILPDASPDA